MDRAAADAEFARRTEGFWELERRRRRFAERLAAELARDPYGRHGAGNEFVAAGAVQVRFGSRTGQRLPLEYAGVSVGAQGALEEAPRLVMTGSAVGQVDGIGGTVWFVHSFTGDDWSVVVPVRPYTGLVLVCLDEPADQCLHVAGDDPATVAALERFRSELELAVKHRAEMIAAGLRPPDPVPLRRPG